MICVAISDKDHRKCIATLTKVQMAEIRLDLTEFDNDAIDAVFAQEVPLVATCRPDNMSEQDQYFKLRRAIEAGANYVDIEYEAPEAQREALIEIARKHNCKVIISYHNYDETPGLRELYKIVDECYEKGGDIAKIATMVNSSSDSGKILSLYSVGKPMIAIGMGEQGKATRVMAPFLGAEFTFAAQDGEEGTAPGQIPYSDMITLLKTLNNSLKPTS